MDKFSERTAIEELSANVLETRFENFDEATLLNAKNRVVDIVGCVVGGAHASGNSSLVDLVKGWGGNEEATILIHGGKVPALHAAMVNSIMARSFDFEPLCPLVGEDTLPGAHISATTITTAMTLGEMKGINGKELITAFLVGDDVASRVLAGYKHSFAQGWELSGTVAMLGATAVAGRLFGLTRTQMKNAFGIVLNQLAGSTQVYFDGTTDFKLPQGLSARNGIFSAQLAKAGWTGANDALLGKYGFYRLYTDGCTNPQILTKNLGKEYYSDGIFKPYSCCRGTHSGIHCALELLRNHSLKVEEIEEVIVYAHPHGKSMEDSFVAKPFRIGGFPHADAVFSLQFTVANALLRKGVKPEHFSEDAIRDPQLNALIGRIKLVEQPPPLHLRKVEVKVKLKNGEEFSESTQTPKGDPVNNPMSKDEIIAKFMANVDFAGTLSKQKTERILALLDRKSVV